MTQHIKHITDHGYILEQKCPLCKTKEKIIVKPSLYKIGINCILYLNQIAPTMYKIDWPYDQKSIQLCIGENQQQWFTMQSSVSQMGDIYYTTQWRTNHKTWYTLDKGKVTQLKCDNSLKKYTTKVCLLFFNNTKIN